MTTNVHQPWPQPGTPVAIVPAGPEWNEIEIAWVVRRTENGGRTSVSVSKTDGSLYQFVSVSQSGGLVIFPARPGRDNIALARIDNPRVIQGRQRNALDQLVRYIASIPAEWRTTERLEAIEDRVKIARELIEAIGEGRVHAG